MTIKVPSSARPASRYPKRVIERTAAATFDPNRIEKLIITFKTEPDPDKRVLEVLVPRRVALRFHWWMRSRPRGGMIKA